MFVMNIAVILSGGKGTRLNNAIPKQYIQVSDKWIIEYCLDTFQAHQMVDGFIIVAEKEWQGHLDERIGKKYSKLLGFADAGSSRQASILSGLTKIREMTLDVDYIIIHDAARPNLSKNLITACFQELIRADGVMPVLPVKDTIYFSEKGKTIGSLLNRDQLFAGQAPEGFLFDKYLALHEGLSDLELSGIRGSSEIAFKNGLTVNLIPGEESNYKITTIEDLNKFKLENGE